MPKNFYLQASLVLLFGIVLFVYIDPLLSIFAINILSVVFSVEGLSVLIVLLLLRFIQLE